MNRSDWIEFDGVPKFNKRFFVVMDGKNIFCGKFQKLSDTIIGFSSTGGFPIALSRITHIIEQKRPFQKSELGHDFHGKRLDEDTLKEGDQVEFHHPDFSKENPPVWTVERVEHRIAHLILGEDMAIDSSYVTRKAHCKTLKLLR